MRQPAQLDLERDRDVALGIFGRLAGVRRRHLDIGRQHVRVRLDVEMRERDDPGAEQSDKERQDQHPLLQGKGDDAVHGRP
jgi:hypothetical protein